MSSSSTPQQSNHTLIDEQDLRDAARTESKGRKTLDECVICLQPVSERAVAVPCNHLAFDFICLVSWLQEHRQCPLCKTELSAVQYDFRGPDDFKTYVLPSESKSISTPNGSEPHTFRSRPHVNRFHNRQRTYRRARSELCPITPDHAIQRRRFVYREQLYSLHVGSNRLSRFKDFTPQFFAHSPELQARARKWIRRELQVFDFLSPDLTSTPSTAVGRRRAENAEFILLYLIAILKTVDIKGSNGKAEEMLQDYLGQDNARLFLHELEAWLRSPFNALEDWDRAVQYRIPLPQYPVPNGTTQDSLTLANNPRKDRPESPRNELKRRDESRSADLEWQRCQARVGYVPD